MLQYAHNEHAHVDIRRIYNLFFRSVFMSNMKKIITEYVIICFQCQFSKFSKLSLYEKLQFIEISTKFLTELNLNFIVALSMISEKSNVIFIVTDRFFKWVKIVSKSKTLSTKKWKKFYWQYVIKNWDISAKLINDRDSKFISNFWKIVFKQCEVSLNLTTVYHLSIDEQTERTNHTIKTILRCFFVDRYEKNWQNILFQMKYVLNIFENVVIKISFFEILYDVKLRNSLTAIIRKNIFKVETNFFEKQKQIRLNTIDAVRLIQTRMIIQFDKKHKSFDMTNKIYLKMTKIKQSNYSIFKSSSLIAKKLKSFVIKKRVNFLTYEFDFSFKMKMHFVMSVIHLKQIKKKFYEKKVVVFKVFDSKSILIQKKSHYVIEKILSEKSKNDLSDFLIKWKKYEKTTWKSKKKCWKTFRKWSKNFELEKNVKIFNSSILLF